MASNTHEYEARLVWTGNTGRGTADYASYGRGYRVSIGEKPDLAGSADASFRGDARLHNPEDHVLAALVGCHMLSYLALCARRGVRVLAYEDEAHGLLRLQTNGGGAFEHVTLSPRVVVADAEHVTLATELHDLAAELCFIAGSCRTPIRHQPTVLCESALVTSGGSSPDV
jgi:organic hydroperoxide reductase OsmC/OhrA